MENHEFPNINDPEIREYSKELSSFSDPLLANLEEKTAETGHLRMISGQYLGRILSMVSKIVKPKIALEIGTFTGYGTLCLAEGLQEGGVIYTLDKSDEWTEIANSYWENHPHRDKIKLIKGDAIESLRALDGPFDLVFIDAAKKQYIDYFEIVMEKMPSGGLIMADNVLWKGKVVSEYNDALGKALHDFNHHVMNDPRVENILLPVDDGLNLIRKK